MTKAAWILPLIAMTAACGGETTREFEDDEGNRGEVTYDRSGASEATFKTDEGEVRMRSGADAPVRLPDGFSLYPGAEVLTSTIADSSGEAKSGSMTNFKADAAPEELVAYYRGQAEDAGYDIKMEMKTAQGTMIGGTGPDGANFSLNVRDGGDGKSAATLIYGEGG